MRTDLNTEEELKNSRSCLYLEMIHYLTSLRNIDLIAVLHNSSLLFAFLEENAFPRKHFLSAMVFLLNTGKYRCFSSEKDTKIENCHITVQFVFVCAGYGINSVCVFWTAVL